MQVLHNSMSATSQAAEQRDPRKPRRKAMLRLLKYREFLLAIGSGILMLTAWGIGSLSQVLSVIVYIMAYTVGGYVKAKEGLTALVKDRHLDVNLLMITAAIGAASIGYWNEGAMLIFIFALSGALESFASDQSQKDISALVSLKPDMATKVDDQGLHIVKVEELEIGELVLVRPGEVIPVDGIVHNGATLVNEAAITGESLPVDKGLGDTVYAGTLNGQGAIYIEVTSRAEGTLFAKIISLVEQAQRQTPVSQQFIKRIEGIYVKGVIVVTIALLLVGPLAFSWSWPQTFYKAMVFLVVASPCAIVSSVMPAMLAAMSKSARKGVLFKGAAHMDQLGSIKVIAFDKTGTLTAGQPEVTEVYTVNDFEQLELLQACASAESLSEHPLARAIVRRAEQEGLRLVAATEMRSITGWGIEATVDGQVWWIGKADENDEAMPLEMQEHLKLLTATGQTVSAIRKNGQYAGLIAFQDTVRPQTVQAISRLHQMGIATLMLTGDRCSTAQAVAQIAGVTDVFGDLLPVDKVRHVKELVSRYGHVAMVGDGLNDAPALASATVGIAMGGGGVGAALEVADVVLMNDRLEMIADTIELARRARRIVKQNLIFAACVIVLLIIGNFIQDISLPLGVLGHEGSTLLVILNGLRLLR